MSAFLYLGKMRINKVTCHKIGHHYDYLICILQAVSEICVHFVIGSHRDANNLLHVQVTPTFTGLSPSPSTHRALPCAGGTSRLVTDLLHSWALLLFLSILRKAGINWREFRGEGVNGQRKREPLGEPGWPGLVWQLGCASQRATTGQGEQRWLCNGNILESELHPFPLALVQSHRNAHDPGCRSCVLVA